MYWSLIAADVDWTAASDLGCTAELGMYVESSVVGGCHVVTRVS